MYVSFALKMLSGKPDDVLHELILTITDNQKISLLPTRSRVRAQLGLIRKNTLKKMEKDTQRLTQNSSSTERSGWLF
jgi:hypothetical protein